MSTDADTVMGERPMVVERLFRENIANSQGCMQMSTAKQKPAAQLLERAQSPRLLLTNFTALSAECGYGLIRQIRALPAEAGGATPAVALTAYARTEDRMQAILAGFQHHVAKPVEPAELVAMVASLCQRSVLDG